MDIPQLKSLAARIRELLKQSSCIIGHSQSLDLIAALAGLRNWPEVQSFPQRVNATSLDLAAATRLADRLNEKLKQRLLTDSQLYAFLRDHVAAVESTIDESTQDNTHVPSYATAFLDTNAARALFARLRQRRTGVLIVGTPRCAEDAIGSLLMVTSHFGEAAAIDPNVSRDSTEVVLSKFCKFFFMRSIASAYASGYRIIIVEYFDFRANLCAKYPDVLFIARTVGSSVGTMTLRCFRRRCLDRSAAYRDLIAIVGAFAVPQVPFQTFNDLAIPADREIPDELLGAIGRLLAERRILFTPDHEVGTSTVPGSGTITFEPARIAAL